MGTLNDRREARAALALAGVERLGPRRIRLLVDSCGSACAALDALARGGAPGIPDPEGRAKIDPELRARLARLRLAPEMALRRLEERGIRLVARGASGYPTRLDHLPDPPALLWVAGPGALPTERAVAIVGTRRATEYGRRIARDVAAGLATYGWTVVSGMAAGIDGAAHRGALDAGGATVGVLGSGPDHEYPKANADLYERMRKEGLLASEFPPEERPRRRYFPRRNRVIAALGDAVVVVQAGRSSGALITADHALDLGREVLAVPGPVGAPGSAGVHGLLRDGAGVATSAEDVLRELGVDPELEASPPVTGKAGTIRPAREDGHARAIWRQLSAGPRPVDDLAASAGLPVGEALALLARLEVAGAVRAVPGGRYERVAAAARQGRAT